MGFSKHQSKIRQNKTSTPNQSIAIRTPKAKLGKRGYASSRLHVLTPIKRPQLAHLHHIVM